MKPRRLSILAAMATVMFVAVCSLNAAPVSAQDYPNKPITLIIPTKAGGGYDLGARNVARFLPAHLPHKVNIVCQNMPGGGQMIAVHALYAAKPDGYTIGAFNALAALLAKFIRPGQIKFDITKFNFLGMWQDDIRAIGVSNAFKVKTWQELVARSEKKPILVGTGGAGSGQHVDPLMIEAVTDAKFKYVHYNGSAQVTPAIGRNEVEMEVAQVATTQELKDNGIGRTFCVLSEKRSSLAPDVPTALEVGMPADQFQKLMDSPFFGVNRVIAAPPGMDPKLVELLRKAVWETFQDPDYLEHVKKLKGIDNPMKGEDYQKVIAKKLKVAEQNPKLVEMMKF